jgi:putative polyhydroxyalkanoate system protein
MTRPVSISIPHELGAAEARRRIDEGVEKLVAQAGGGMAKIQKTWEGDRLHFIADAIGQRMTGRLDVLEKEVRMEIDLPTFLAVIADKFKGRLRKEGQLLLEKK